LHNSVLTVQDVYGDTPLHCLCGNLHGGSAELTRLVLQNTADYGADDGEGYKIGGKRRREKDGKALPTVHDLLSYRNFHGCTPMHFSVDGGCTPEILELVLDACQTFCNSMRVHGKSDEDMLLDVMDPDIPLVEQKHPICIQDEDGDTALHFACAAGLEPRLLRRLVIQPDRTVVSTAMITKAANGRTPVDELIAWCIDEFGLESNVLDPPLEERLTCDVADALWSRIEVMLQAVVYGRHKVYDMSKPLHWAASIQSFPAVILRMACKRFGGGNGLLSTDKNQMTLLHHAVAPVCWNETDSSMYELRSGEYLELSRWESDDEKRSPIEYLIQKCPDALQVRSKGGSLPLHSALMSGRIRMKDIEAMLDAAPATLAQRDGQGLLPFMIAASRGDHHLDEAFKLLLLNPELVRSISTEEDSKL